MSKTQTEPKGAERVAALLLSLDKGTAAGLMKHLQPDVIAEVADAMTRLAPEHAEPERISAIKVQLARAAHAPAQTRAPKPGELRELLKTSIGDKRADEVVREIQERRAHEHPFQDLEARPADVIARVLKRESPAVVALVLAHFDPELSAKVLASFEPADSLQIVQRMAAIAQVSFETLRGIAQELERQAKAVAAEPTPPDPSWRMRTIADMLNRAGQELEQSVMSGLRNADAETAQQIRELMFTWDDIAELDKRSMQRILGSVNTTALAMALKACAPPVEQNIMANLSTRSRAMVAEERELAGPVPMSQVLSARAEIMQAVRSLMDSGEFKPARGGDDLVS